MRKFQIKAQGDTAEILLYDVIGRDFFGEGVTAKSFAEDLKALGDVKTIKLRINSPGGDVFDGMAIYSLLAQHPAKIDVAIDGLAASVASLIAMAGDSITISESAFLMIHDPWALVVGDSGDMRNMAETLEKIGNTMAGIYANRAGMGTAVVRALMKEETWYAATEAVWAGLADQVTATTPAGQPADLKDFEARFKRIPKALLSSRKADTENAPAAKVSENPAGAETLPETQAVPEPAAAEAAGVPVSIRKRQLELASLA